MSTFGFDRIVQVLGTSLDFYPSRCTIRMQTVVVVKGQATYETSDLIVDIPCRVAPDILERPTDSEKPGQPFVYTSIRRRVALARYVPQIQAHTQMTAVIDGTEFNILGVEHDGNKTYTRLRVELVSPSATNI